MQDHTFISRFLRSVFITAIFFIYLQTNQFITSVTDLRLKCCTVILFPTRASEMGDLKSVTSVSCLRDSSLHCRYLDWLL